MQVYKGAAKDLIETNVKPYFAKVLQQYRAVSERELQDATFFFMEYVEHCDKSDVLMLIELCQQYADITLWTKPDMADIRQNTVYGIGVMSKYVSPNAFKSLLPKAL